MLDVVELTIGQQQFALYVCIDGYILQGNDTIECFLGSEWSAPPSCTIADCLYLKNIDNGFVDLQNGTTFGSIAIYQCNPGFYISAGDEVRVCEADERWNGTAPTCSDIDCGLPPTGINTIGPPLYNMTTFGSLATFSCLTGYNTSGNLTVSCNADGNWTAAPTCRIKDCGPPPTGINTTGPPLYNLTTFGSLATFSCLTGYNTSGNLTVSCNAYGNWTAAPTCRIKNCGPPPTGINTAGPPLYNLTTFGSVALFTCLTGYNTTDNLSVSCNADGNWTADPLCRIKNCTELTTPSNGVKDSNDVAFGTIVSFACYNGYTLSRSSALQCLANSTWNDTAPSCEINNCTELTTPTNGVKDSNDVAFGTVVSFACDNGYTLSRSSALRCLANSTWNDTVPSCEMNFCPTLTTPGNGVKDSDSTSFGTVVSFACKDGYTLKGTSVLQCLANSTWNDTVPSCEINNCTDLTTPSNGIKDSNAVTFGTIVVFACDNGYTLSGSSALQCLANSTWNHTAPSCEINICPILESESNLTVTLSQDPPTYGATAEFSCLPGFTLVGINQTECQANGQWNASIPFCVIKFCQQLPVLENGFLGGSETPEYGAVVNFSCATGYELEGNQAIRCEADSQWNGSMPVCNIVDCGIPEDPSWIIEGNTSTTTYGSILEYECLEGYNLVGDKSRTCQANKTWSGTSPQCEILECSALPEISNGVKDSSVFEFGSTVIYSCNPRFALVGSASLYCQANGTWTNEIPVCQLAECESLFEIENGSKNSVNFSIGNDVVYSCNPGFTLSGDATLTCQDNGQWSSTPPTCELIECTPLPDFKNGVKDSTFLTFGSDAIYRCDPGYAMNGSAILTCQEDGQWNSSPPTCELIECEPPLDIENGVKNSATLTFGSDVTYLCDSGYTLNGNAILTCRENGKWSSSPPSCEKIVCTLPPDIENGVKNSSTLTFGSDVFYSCAKGFVMNGDAVLTCQENGEWSSTPPKCFLIVCSNLNGSPNRRDNSTANQYGSIITFSCDSGFFLVGSPSITCLANGQWNASAPTCEKQAPSPCPQNTDDRGTVWPKTAAGNVVLRNCSQGFTGTISRQCRDDGTWALPRYNCIRPAVQNAEQKVSSLTTNATKDEVEEALGELLTVTKVDNAQGDEKLTDGELLTMSRSLDTVATIITKDVDTKLAEDFLQTADNLIDDTNKNSWESLKESNSSGAARVIVAVDKFAVGYAKQIRSNNESKIIINRAKIALEIGKVNNTDIVLTTSTNDTSNIRIPAAALQDSPDRVYAGTFIRNVSDIVPTRSDKDDKDNTKIINGAIIGMSLDPPIKDLSPPVEIIFQHSEAGFDTPSCTFWFDANSSSYWSTEGCRVKNTSVKMTVCECDHLTNFAVLMSPFQEADVNSVALRVVSIVGISISITCLLITLLVHMCLWRYLRSDRVTILMNLMVALIIAYIVFLAGVDRTESKEFCAAVAVILQYIYLVAFCVMLAEGIEIGITVMFVFAKKSRIKILLSLAWIIPAIIVGISLGVTRAEGYGNENFCWLSIESGLIWAFVGPALVIIVFNVICLSVVIHAMFKTKSMSEKKKMDKFKTSVRSLCVLVPLMGITWIIGIFNINRDFAWIQYVFAICNGLQGFFIFIFHCLFNAQVKKAYEASERRRSSTSMKSTLKSSAKEDRRSSNKQSNSRSFSDNENSGQNRPRSKSTPEFPIFEKQIGFHNEEMYLSKSPDGSSASSNLRRASAFSEGSRNSLPQVFNPDSLYFKRGRRGGLQSDFIGERL